MRRIFSRAIRKGAVRSHKDYEEGYEDDRPQLASLGTHIATSHRRPLASCYLLSLLSDRSIDRSILDPIDPKARRPLPHVLPPDQVAPPRQALPRARGADVARAAPCRELRVAVRLARAALVRRGTAAARRQAAWFACVCVCVCVCACVGRALWRKRSSPTRRTLRFQMVLVPRRRPAANFPPPPPYPRFASAVCLPPRRRFAAASRRGGRGQRAARALLAGKVPARRAARLRDGHLAGARRDGLRAERAAPGESRCVVARCSFDFDTPIRRAAPRRQQDRRRN